MKNFHPAVCHFRDQLPPDYRCFIIKAGPVWAYGILQVAEGREMGGEKVRWLESSTISQGTTSGQLRL